MDQIAEIRLRHHRGESIRSIAKSCGYSRNTVTKFIRSDVTRQEYPSRKPVLPVIGEFTGILDDLLSANLSLPKKSRLTWFAMFERIQQAGYKGGYDSVRRYARKWCTKNSQKLTAFVPLEFAKGEAFQFDWSEEKVKICGETTKVYVAQIILCHSRLRFCKAFTKMGLEMVLDAHISAHDFFDGLCEVGIYDNLKTVVKSILQGKSRGYNERFMELASHYLFEPRACTPRSGWEKGQVERQVHTVRQRFFAVRDSFTSVEEINDHLQAFVIKEAHTSKHPDIPDKTVWQVYEDEKQYLVKQAHKFDGCVIDERRVSTECLVQYDKNFYSVPCNLAGRSVSLHIYSGKISFLFEGKSVASHQRLFGKDLYSFEPLHYLPILQQKPGALRNGMPFKHNNWPSSIWKVWKHLKSESGGDKKMVKILSAIPCFGLEAVSVACSTAIESGIISDVVVLNHLSRLTEETTPEPVLAPDALSLNIPPVADCSRYDNLLGGGKNAA